MGLLQLYIKYRDPEVHGSDASLFVSALNTNPMVKLSQVWWGEFATQVSQYFCMEACKNPSHGVIWIFSTK